MRVAAVQATPAFLDREQTIAIVEDRIAEASSGGADLVVFPEVFVPGYPVWMDRTNSAAWEDPDQQAAYAWYLDQSVDVHGPEFEMVVDAVLKLRALFLFGFALGTELIVVKPIQAMS